MKETVVLPAPAVILCPSRSFWGMVPPGTVSKRIAQARLPTSNQSAAR